MPTHHSQSRLLSTPLPKSSMPAHAPAAVKSGVQGGGQTLDKHKSAEMSARFGHDFSHIRIHTDARAGEAADAMGANAYALGGDIVFGAGKYNPGSRETDRLLAHELTHVVQQSQFGAGDWGRASVKGDSSEREADSLASQVMMGRSVSVQAAPGAAVARDEDGIGMATDENGDAPLDLSRGGQFGIPPQVLEANAVESTRAAAAFTPDLGESVSSNPGFTSKMGESVDSGPTQAAARAAGGAVGTAAYDSLADSGLGKPFVAPDPSGLSGILQSYQIPDGLGLEKAGYDTFETLSSAGAAVPFFGNAWSVGATLGDLGAAAVGAVTGDDRTTQSSLYAAEDNALNAIPLLGNLRAAGQAGHDVSTLQNDFNPNIPEANNLTAQTEFDTGEAQQLNHSIGNTFDQLF